MPNIYKQKVKGKSYWRIRLRKPISKARAGYMPEKKGVKFLVQRVDSISRPQAVLIRADKFTKKEAKAKARRYRKKIELEYR
jgi:hypothetical protein